MGEIRCKVKINGTEKEYEKGTSFSVLAAEYQSQYKDDIVLVLFNNHLHELNRLLEQDGELSFITTKDKAGRKAYRRSVTLLMQRGVYELAKKENAEVSVRVEHSISQGYYCELYGKDGKIIPDNAYLLQLKMEMMRFMLLPLTGYEPAYCRFRRSSGSAGARAQACEARRRIGAARPAAP